MCYLRYCRRDLLGHQLLQEINTVVGYGVQFLKIVKGLQPLLVF